jgi:hypothetical protein
MGPDAGQGPFVAAPTKIAASGGELEGHGGFENQVLLIRGQVEPGFPFFKFHMADIPVHIPDAAGQKAFEAFFGFPEACRPLGDQNLSVFSEGSLYLSEAFFGIFVEFRALCCIPENLPMDTGSLMKIFPVQGRQKFIFFLFKKGIQGFKNIKWLIFHHKGQDLQKKRGVSWQKLP